MGRFCVSGGAGFIGSHLADRLISEGGDVLVIDNLSSGLKGNVNPKAVFVPIDLAKSPPAKIAELLRGVDEVWHFAANSSVPRGEIDREVDLNSNVIGTRNLLEACVRASVRSFFLASSSAVYGRLCAKKPAETAGPCRPISMYGASKLAGEGFLSAYCDNFGIGGVSFRLANVVGARQRSGLLADLLKQNEMGPLKVLGNGTQKKSYIHVSDCVEGMLKAKAPEGEMEIYNVGSTDSISVKRVAELVAKRKGFGKVTFLGGKTWAGDVPEMSLKISKLKSLGWSPKLKSCAAVKLAMEELLADGGPN